MNIPGVTMAATPRAPVRTLRRPPVTPTSATPKCIEVPKTTTVNIPPPTPSMKRRATERLFVKQQDKEAKYEHEWTVSDVGLKDNIYGPYMPKTVNYNGVEVFIPPTIDPRTDKITVVDLGGLDKEETGRYIIIKDKYRPIERPPVKGDITYITIDDDGIARLKKQNVGEAIPQRTNQGLLIPVCATPRITEAPRNNGLSLNILAEMTK